MEYCLGPGDGTASMWTGQPDVDADGDGTLDGIGLDFDGDGLRDDALIDADGDGVADHAALDFGSEDAGARWFTDDGTGTWALSAEHATRAAGGLRWVALDGVEHTGGPLIDFDDDGAADDRVYDLDGDGLADRVLCGDGGDGFDTGYVDTDGDGQWNTKLLDTDGDGAADQATAL